MSDNYIHIIPEVPGFIPDNVKQQAAVEYFRDIAHKADEITATVTASVELVHCGSNFGRIACPACRSVIEIDQWQNWMDADFQGDGKGFVLSKRNLRCCNVTCSLHDLAYEWPIGFSRLTISAMNPDIGKISQQQCDRFNQILGCPTRIIYEHL